MTEKVLKPIDKAAGDSLLLWNSIFIYLKWQFYKKRTLGKSFSYCGLHVKESADLLFWLIFFWYL